MKYKNNCIKDIIAASKELQEDLQKGFCLQKTCG